MHGTIWLIIILLPPDKAIRFTKNSLIRKTNTVNTSFDIIVLSVEELANLVQIPDPELVLTKITSLTKNKK